MYAHGYTVRRMILQVLPKSPVTTCQRHDGHDVISPAYRWKAIHPVPQHLGVVAANPARYEACQTMPAVGKKGTAVGRA